MTVTRISARGRWPVAPVIFAAFVQIVASEELKQPPTSKEVYEPRELCGRSARAWFSQNYGEPTEPIPLQSGGSISTTPASYENHYSVRKNDCFAIIS